MSGLLGKTKTLERIPSDVQASRKQTAGYLTGVGPAGTQASTYLNDPSFVNQIIDPYRQLFSMNRQRSLAQAKESAGNLTGSGFASALGTEVNRSLTTENAALSDILNQHAESSARNFLQLLLGMNTAGVAAPEVGYQPGILDQLISAGGQIGAAAARK